MSERLIFNKLTAAYVDGMQMCYEGENLAGKNVKVCAPGHVEVVSLEAEKVRANLGDELDSEVKRLLNPVLYDPALNPFLLKKYC